MGGSLSQQIGAGGKAGRADASRLGAVAALLAGSVLLSRVLGYLRDMVLANRAGAGPDVDAYAMAFVVPDLLNYLLAGGALAIAFIPLYSRVLERDGEVVASRLFHTVLGTLGAIAVVVTLGMWVWAEEIAAAALSGFDPERRALAVRLTRIVLPAQIFFVTGGILRAVLMAHGRFAAQAAAPLVYNGCVIVGGLVGGDVEGFAWGTLVGAVVGQWLVPLFELRGLTRVGLRLGLLDPHFRRYVWIAAPLMLGISLTTVDEIYEKFFAQQLEVGAIAQLHYARKLMMAPVAVVGQAIGAAALPVLAALWSSGRAEELNRVLNRTLRVALSLGVFAAAGLYAFSSPLVEVLFHHGRFTAEAAERAGRLLGIMAFAVPGWVAQQVLVRAFYAREDTWRPMILGTGVALAVIPLYLLLRDQLGLEGLALAGAVALTTNGLATYVWAQLRFGGLEPGGLLASLARSAAIAAPAAWLSSLAKPGLATGWVGTASDLVVGAVLFGAISCAGVFAIGDAPMREAFRNALARLRPKRR
jgi:putative peptidoglycan lipid II flippase